MEFKDTYSWDAQDDDKKKEDYRNLLAEYRAVKKILDGYVKIASRLSDY